MKRRDFLYKTIAGMGALPAVRLGQWEGGETQENAGASSGTQLGSPALIPLPRSLIWTGQAFMLNRSLQISYSSRAGGDVKRVADFLARQMRRGGAEFVQVQPGGSPGPGTIRLVLGTVAAPINQEEAYRLHVTEEGVHLKAASATGLFWGTQTLRQLHIDPENASSFIAGCEIEDGPAFRVRGMMHDVGRNYVGLTQRTGAVKTFNRQICDTDQGTKERLGGILCIWNDRRPAREEDIMLMNGVYPQMLAFAERAWRGGGRAEPDVRIGVPRTPKHQAFAQFENRLVAHGKRYFDGEPFPYVRQAHVPWTLIGLFPKDGDLSAAFFPERVAARPVGQERASQSTFLSEATNVETKRVVGGTIWLRHCFAPFVTGHLSDPKSNGTVYAVTYVRTDREREAHMWISFHNPSRSERDDTPPLGHWDYKHSKIWLNDRAIDPPRWSKPGRKGHDEAPYIDESYEYRAPTPVTLNAGWNRVLVKAPIGDFSSEHTRLVKWMFTAVLVERDGACLQALDGVEYAASPKELF